MSFSNWLHHIATRGYLIALVAILSFPALGQVQPKPEEPSAKTQTDRETVAVPDSAMLLAIFDELVKIRAAEKAENSRSDERKERREDATLIAQQDSTYWAKVTAIVAAIAAVLSAGTIGLVWGTFKETRRTADAAVKAATAADTSVRLQADLEAPFVYPVVMGSGPLAEIYKDLRFLSHPTSPFPPVHPAFHCVLKNHGRTAALLQFARLELAHFETAPDEMPISVERDFGVPPILEPGGESKQLSAVRIEVALDRAALQSIAAGDSFLFFFGDIYFGSVGGTPYVQTFCLAYDHTGGAFAPWHPKLNQRQRRDQP